MIKTWQQRCEEHPDHDGIVSERMIQARMQEEIDELRDALESRQWQGLTDEERHGIREWQRIQTELGPVWAPMLRYLYDTIETKLREKNT